MIVYEASVLRYCPDAVAGEYANVGLLVAQRDPDQSYPQIRFEFASHSERLSTFFASYYRGADWTLWRRAIRDNFSRLQREYEAGPLTSSRQSFESILSAISPHGYGAFRWASPFNGAETSLDAAFDHWFKRLVTQHEVNEPEEYVTDEDFWREQQPVAEAALHPFLATNLFSFDRAVGDDEPENFRIVWRADGLHALDAVSLTVRTAKTIKSKQQRTVGKLWGVKRRIEELSCTVLVSPPRETNLSDAFHRAKAELQQAPGVRHVIEPDDLRDYLIYAARHARPI